MHLPIYAIANQIVKLLIAILWILIYSTDLISQCASTADTKDNNKDCLQLIFSGTPSPDPPNVTNYIHISGSGGGTYVYRNINQNNCNGGGWTPWNGTITINGSTCTYSSGNLPITLVEFKASSTSRNSVKLEWTTASELNNEYFTIERSPDAISFAKIGEVPGRGTTIEPSHYVFTDQYPFSGINYYRLVQYDYDGAFEISRIIATDFGEDIRINQQNNFLMLQAQKEVEAVLIYNINGTLVKKFTSNDRIYYIGDLESGYYVVSTTFSSRIVNRKLLIK